MKNFICILTLFLLLCACGGQAPSGDGLDTTKMEKPDSESIVSLAQVMGEDLARFLHEDDIQSAAALCQEGLDNIMYFRDTGDTESEEIYANYLHKFVKKHYDDMEDMATQNYVVKQFMAAVGDSAILHAQRRRWPQEEETHHEPTIEADGPLPSRPAVRHWRQKEGDESSAKAVKTPQNQAVKNQTQAVKSQNKTVNTQQKAQKNVVNKPVATEKKTQPAAKGKTQTSKSAPQQTAKTKQTQTKTNVTAVGKNTKTKGNKEPVIVKCKKQRTETKQQNSGEATSSQWYLVRPLD